MKFRTIFLISLMLGACNSDKIAQTNTNSKGINQKELLSRKDSNYLNLTCDSLMILLIKSSSIDKVFLNERIGIDSVKNKVVYLTFSHINKANGTEHNSEYLDIDFNKKEIREITENVRRLRFDSSLMNYIIRKGCYFNNVDYVTDTTNSKTGK